MQRESITKTAVFYHVSTAEPAGILGVLGTFPSKRTPEKGCNAAEGRSTAEEKRKKSHESVRDCNAWVFLFLTWANMSEEPPKR